MRIFISVDMEGVAGASGVGHMTADGPGYAEARRWMTDETLAAIAGAREAGATGFVIADSHGSGHNLELDRLPPEAALVQGWPRPLMMMQGIESGDFAGAFLIGHHAGAHSVEGGLAHTMNSRLYASVEVNGRPWSETDINRAVAAEHGAPILLATGDDAYTAHVREAAPEARAATVKWTYGATSARTLTPARAQELIRAEARAAVEAAATGAVSAPEPQAGPLRARLVLKRRQAAEMLALLPFARRDDAHAIAFECASASELGGVLYVFGAYNAPGFIF